MTRKKPANEKNEPKKLDGGGVAKLILGVLAMGVITAALLLSGPKDSPTKSFTVSSPEIPQIIQAESNKKTLQIKNLSLDAKRLVVLNTKVDDYAVDALIRRLNKLDRKKKPIYMIISSPGGSVFAGAKLLSVMEGLKSPIYTICTRVCASMAAVIHQYGTKRYATNRSVLMFHPASGGVRGQVPNMINMLKMIDRYIKKMDEHIVSRIKISREEYYKRVAYEIWLEADKAKEEGFVDKIVNIQDIKMPFLGRPNLNGQKERKKTKTGAEALEDFILWKQ